MPLRVRTESATHAPTASTIIVHGAVEETLGVADALRRLEMGVATRVSLQFEHDPWPGQDSFSRDGFLFTGEPPFPVWWVSHPAPRPVITGWAGGCRALALATLGETERVGAALEALGAAVGVDTSRLRGELRGGFCHDWQSDPFARGSYSYAGVGGGGAGTELAVPVDSTLFFRGRGHAVRRAQRDGPRRPIERAAGGEADARTRSSAHWRRSKEARTHRRNSSGTSWPRGRRR